MAEEEKKLSPFTLAAGAVASVLSMLVGSLLGDAGTLIGAAVGSITYSTGAFVVEDRARRAHAKLKARKEQDRANAEPGKHYLQQRIQANPLGEQALIRARVRQDLQRQGWNPRRKIMMAAGMLGLCLFAAAATLFTVEGATGKTLSSNLGGPAQYGTTLGGFTTSHSPSPRPSVQVTPESPSAGSGAPSGVLPDASPDAVPDATPSTAIPSQTFTGVSSGQG
jgi:hypothetical protein